MITNNRPNRRGFAEPSVIVENPLPVMSDEDVLKRATLDELFAPRRRGLKTPGHITFTHSTGLDAERLVLAPGETFVLKQSDGECFLRTRGELGGIWYPMDATEDQKHDARVKGLQRAITFYHQRGAPRIAHHRMTHRYSKDDAEDYKYEIWSYYYNAAIADIIRDHLKSLKRPKPAKSTQAPAAAKSAPQPEAA